MTEPTVALTITRTLANGRSKNVLGGTFEGYGRVVFLAVKDATERVQIQYYGVLGTRTTISMTVLEWRALSKSVEELIGVQA